MTYRRQPPPAAKVGVDMQTLNERLQALEAATFPTDSAPDEPSTLHVSPPVEARSLVFTLADGSPQKTRVTLDHTEVVLFGSWSTPSKPRTKGSWISVLIEVIGNPGDQATINMTNSNLAQLVSAPIPDGQTHIADPRVIEADWQ